MELMLTLPAPRRSSHGEETPGSIGLPVANAAAAERLEFSDQQGSHKRESFIHSYFTLKLHNPHLNVSLSLLSEEIGVSTN